MRLALLFGSLTLAFLLAGFSAPLLWLGGLVAGLLVAFLHLDRDYLRSFEAGG